MLLRIVSIIFPLFAIVLAGWLYGRVRRPDMSFANQINMDVFVPALVFATLAGKSFDLANYQPLALGAVIVVLGSGLLAWPLARLMKVEAKTFVPPMMFNNSGNMGLPLAVLAFGEAALPAAVVLFLVENLLHFSLGIYMLDHRARLWNVWRMPVMLAALAGLAVSLAGAALRPLMGMAIAWAAARLLGLDAQHSAMLFIFGALPPAVLNYVFAERYGQEPEKVASIVMIGNVAALLFISLALAIALG